MNNTTLNNTSFYNDVINGLSASPKKLPSKYFYDAKGDSLFQQIMGTPEYYLTNSDMEIFSQQSCELAKILVNGDENFEILELGAGNAIKSTYLLKTLVSKGKKFTYCPIDISSNIIETLLKELPIKISEIKIKGLTGEYLEMTSQFYSQSHNKKLLLFLGSSIGNFELAEARLFLGEIYKMMQPDDLILIGFDLKKDPQQILAAYNDDQGITKAFNLNLLQRINKELGADFDVNAFDHFPTYNPVTGSCISYLISKKNQTISIPDAPTFRLKKHEPIIMELSQKFSVEDIDDLALSLGFSPQPYFFDQMKWFCNAIWKK